MGRFTGRKHAPRVSRAVARTRTEHVSKDAGPDCRRVRHPRPFSIPDDGGGHRPIDRGEFLVRDDAGLVGRPARRRGLDVPRSGSTLRPLPPSAHRPHRRNGRTRGRPRRPHGTGARWPANIALFDAGFASSPVSNRELTAHARAWLAFDEAISFLEHFAGAEADVREGVVNVACLLANLPPAILGEGSFRGFAPRELRSIFEKATECLVHAIHEGTACGGAADDYGFLALMIPTIIFAFSRTPSEQGDTFFRTLAPAVRSAVEDARETSEVTSPG